jgi:CRP-like cAMP-binding protein
MPWGEHVTLKTVPAFMRGDWTARAVTIAQVVTGFVALVGLLAMLTRNPLLLLGFSAVQGLLLVGLALFVLVFVFSQRTLVLEEYGPGEVIFQEGDTGELARYVYIVKSGEVEVVVRQADGSQATINRLTVGDHFGEMALLRHAPRSATIRTLTAVEVFRMSPSNFTALYTALPEFRQQITQIMEERLVRDAARTRRPS